MELTMEEKEKTCAMLACENIAFEPDSIPFYPFPSDYELCVKWIEECKRSEFFNILQEHGPAYFNKRFLVCCEHFDSTMFKYPEYPGSGLRETAVPEFRLPDTDIRRCRLSNFVIEEEPPVIPVIRVISPEILPIDGKRQIFYQSANISAESFLYPDVGTDGPSIREITMHSYAPSTTVPCPTVLSMTESVSEMIAPSDSLPNENAVKAEEKTKENTNQPKVLKKVFLKPIPKPTNGVPIKILKCPVKADTARRKGYKCSMPNCLNFSFTKGGPEFHFFPADPKTCSRWVNKSKSEKIEKIFRRKGAKFLSEQMEYMMCSNHFSDRCFKDPKNRKGGLLSDAYPDIFVEKVKKINKSAIILEKDKNVNTKNINGVCRTCLSTDEPLLKLSESTLIQIKAVISSYGLSLDSSSLPREICISCQAEFRKLDSFKNQIIEVHKIFKCILEYQSLNHTELIKQERKHLSYPSLSYSPMVKVNTPETDSQCSEMTLFSVVSKKKLYRGDVLLSKYQNWKRRIENSKDNFIRLENYASGTTFSIDADLTEELIYHKDCENHDATKKDADTLFSEDSIDATDSQERVEKDTKTKFNLSDEWGLKRRSTMKNDSEYYTVTRISKDEALQQRQEALNAESFLKAEFKCSYCIKTFPYEDSYTTHMNKHLKFSPYQCSICQRYLQRRSDVVAHCKQHYLRFNCKLCPYRATYRFQLMDHFGSEHGLLERTYRCRFCDMVFKKRHNMYLHVNSHHSEETVCDVCAKVFKSALSMRVHKRKYHSPKVFSCDNCPKTFRYPSQLDSHKKCHSSNKDFYCVECDKHFKTQSCLQMHLQVSSFHVNSESLKYQCSKCPKRFPLKIRLAYHMVQHERSGSQSKKTYTCKECEAFTGSLGDLKLHYDERHPEIKPPNYYPCKMCDKVFPTNAYLRAHMKTHTNEKPYRCPDCNKDFSYNSSLTVHMRIKHNKNAKYDQRLKKVRIVEEAPPAEQTPQEVRILMEAPQYFYQSASGVIYDVSTYQTA